MQDKDILSLLNDESFLNYCFGRNDNDISYWEKWIEENHADRDKVKELKSLAILLSQESKEHEVNINLSLLKDKINRRKVIVAPNIFRLRTFRWSITTAASLLLICSVGIYLYQQKKTTTANSQIVKNNIHPGGSKAILTLSNGRRIILTNAQNGKIARQGNIVIQKTKSGEVVYAVSKVPLAGEDSNENMAYNTMATPQGGQYHLTLSDGTHVWLNDTSSIKYPTVFKGNSREVEITGEVYFEVAKNKMMPFSVKTPQQVVEVLGTHFNINSYPDEGDIKTSLLEGSIIVRATASRKAVILSPGQQSLVNNSNIIVKNLDDPNIAAWKDGFFVFDAENIQSIMRKIARWYNIKVIFNGDFNDVVLTGSVSKSKNISEILKTLELTKLVHFRIEDRRVIVMNN